MKRTDVAADRGIVGDRQLVAVQMVDISRLTTHPVEIVPGKFIAVSGVGPKGDSNGSGKTSFLAAVSILLADPQWNLQSNGGKSASGILFRPDAAGLDPSLKATPAQQGYIAAVFAEPDNPEETALTVWIRVSAATAPYIMARWVAGLHVADADSDEERAVQADSLWNKLPRENTISARKMADELYGEAPRCLSYLDTELRPSIPSLLSQQMTKMKPEEIGAALLALSGMSTQLEDENRQRGGILELQGKLRQTESEAVQTQVAEDAELAAIDARDSARQLLDEARTKWRLHTARQYLNALTQDRLAESLLSERSDILESTIEYTATAAEKLAQLRSVNDLENQESQSLARYELLDEKLRDLASKRSSAATCKNIFIEERNQLAPQARRSNGQTAEQSETELDLAVDARTLAKSRLTSAADEVKAAEDVLRDARLGRSGEAGRLAGRLREEAGVQAVTLADAIDLDDNARSKWEPRLYALRDAVVVPHKVAKRARIALADEPGAIIIAADPLELEMPRLVSDGVRYPAALQTLISALAQRLIVREEPVRADDDAIGSSILGTFPEPLVGRDALIRLAVKHLEATQARRQTAIGEAKSAEARWTLAKTQFDASNAVERLSVINAEMDRLDIDISDLDGKIGTATEERAKASKEYQSVCEIRSSHGKSVELAELLLKDARRQEGEARKKLDEARIGRGKIAVEAWRTEFGGTEADAAELSRTSTDTPATRAQTLLRHAAERLGQAIAAFLAGLDNIPEDLAEAVKMRERFAEQSPDKPISFELAAGPLTTRLNGYSDRDRVTRSRIEALRAQRARALGELRVEIANGSQRLTTLQDMIERTVEATLAQVSKALDKMTLYGAALEVVSVRPDGAAPWIWNVTPRWRRSPSGGLVSYKEAANSAQVKVFAIQLVLAALIADTQTVGRVLILDELGNSLGDVNRREVLASLSAVSEQQQVTILGTCQDSVLSDAADYFGELIWFTHATATDAYNQPTRVWGHDAEGERVELTASWLKAGRPHA